ncbi:DNA polymerase III subunit delta' [Chrysiogenes arsenatis]|uniref:DNA polymerase III subunit delta' n=1 Tax=Chrysiogenes arsenatis TaxID=309797 RepID=UPI00040A9558|nr:DNA polymerase III subunit delta' [Chrysiogenes arsenatis]
MSDSSELTPVQRAQLSTLLERETRRGAHHAYIINSSTPFAQQFAQMFVQSLNCRELQAGLPCMECAACRTAYMAIMVIEPEKNTITIDQIREGSTFLESTNLDQRLQYKGLIIVEAHQMTSGDRINRVQENALLKTLEEPPAGSIIFLLTDRPSFFLPTIQSRTARIDLRPILAVEYQRKLEDLQLKKNEILLLLKIGDTDLYTRDDVEFAVNSVQAARGLAIGRLEYETLRFVLTNTERWPLLLKIFRIYLHDLLLFNQIQHDEKIYKLVPCNTYVIVALLQMIAALELTLSTTRSNPKFQLLSLLSRQHCRIA